MIKNIVFDIGNVLVGFNWKQYIAGFGFSEEICDRVAKATVQGPYWNEIDRGVWTSDEILDKFISLDPDISNELEQFYDNFANLLTQFEYTKGMIIDLKRKGFKVYCLSNMSYKAVNECGEALNFLGLCDGYVLSCDVKQIKPELEIYETFLNKYKLKAEECIFIDDLEANIEAAKAVGMQGIWFTSLKAAMGQLKEQIQLQNFGQNFVSSYSKAQRMAALVGVGVIVLVYIVALITSLINGELANELFKVCLGCTFVIPILIWIYIWIVGKLTHKRTIADFNFFEDKE